MPTKASDSSEPVLSVQPVPSEQPVQVVPHKTGNLVKDDPAAAGRKGVEVREARRLSSLSETRQYVESVQVPAAIEAFDDLLADKDPRARRYRFAAADKVLSGTGILTEQKHVQIDVRAEVSALIAAFDPTQANARED